MYVQIVSNLDIDRIIARFLNLFFALGALEEKVYDNGDYCYTYSTENPVFICVKPIDDFHSSVMVIGR